MRQDLLNRLSPKIQDLLASLAAYAAEQELYIVGGFVRDLLLGLEPGDLDLVLVGDAIAFARKLDAEIIEEYPQFGTVKLKMTDHVLEIASARTETYAEPAAFPKVQFVNDIALDLPRRDFTVNALMLSLAQDSFGDLVDLVGGLQDLEQKKLRVFHDQSFIDDPTRILRAQRFAAKYGFEIEAHTQDLMKQAQEHPDFEIWCKKLKNRIESEKAKI